MLCYNWNLINVFYLSHRPILSEELNVLFLNMAQKISFDRRDILGHGGYGVVFKGNIDRAEVAIKRIELARLTPTTFREMNHQREMDHPNIVKLLHVEKDENFL